MEDGKVTQTTRGRGGRRQSYRGRNQGGKQQSFAERKELLLSEQAVSDSQDTQAKNIVTDIPQLSGLMEGEVYITKRQQPTIVDTCSKAFVELCSAVYDNVVTREPKLSESFSEVEFIMCSSWFLAHRSIKIANEFLYKSFSNEYHLHRALEQVRELPTPLASYLQHFGVVKSPTGLEVVPQVVLPSYTGPYHAMEPADVDDGFMALAVDKFPYLLPFGSWKRSIFNAHVNAGIYAHAPLVAATLQPTAVSNGNAVVARANDVIYVNRNGYLPKIDGFKPMSNRRIGNLAVNTWAHVGDIRGSLCFSSVLLSQYVLFLDRIRPYMTFSPIPITLKGDLAILPWARGNHAASNVVSTSFDMETPFELTVNSMWASRIFRFRERLSNAVFNHNITDGAGAVAIIDLNDTELTDLASLDDAVFDFTKVSDSVTLVSALVRKFGHVKT